MTRINRLTETKGFSFTTDSFQEINIMFTDIETILVLSVDNKKLAINISDLKLMRDMLSHAIEGVNNE